MYHSNLARCESATMAEGIFVTRQKSRDGNLEDREGCGLHHTSYRTVA